MAHIIYPRFQSAFPQNDSAKLAIHILWHKPTGTSLTSHMWYPHCFRSGKHSCVSPLKNLRTIKSNTIFKLLDSSGQRQNMCQTQQNSVWIKYITATGFLTVLITDSQNQSSLLNLMWWNGMYKSLMKILYNVYQNFQSHTTHSLQLECNVCDWKFQYTLQMLHQWGWSI